MGKKITFRYQPPIAGNFEVFLVGDFNNWSKTSHKLQENNGIYEISLELDPGKYIYYFLVDNKISLDPNADTMVDGEKSLSQIIVFSEEDYVYIVPFRHKDRFTFEELSLVGDFNNWKPNHNRLYHESDTFYTSVFLNGGTYHYKYLAKGDRWYNEREIVSKKEKKAHENVSYNSKIITSKTKYQVIKKEFINSLNTNEITLKRQIVRIYRYSDYVFEFKAILPLTDVLNVNLHINDKDYALEHVASDEYYSAFNTVIEFSRLDLLYRYSLVIKLKTNPIYANSIKLTNEPNTFSVFVPEDYQVFSLANDLSRRIMYQIMPDRFCNGDSTLSPNFQEEYYQNSRNMPARGGLTKNQEYHHLADWDDISILTENPYSEAKEPDWFVFYGGDLAGIKSKILYLKALGVSLIYLNPIFKAKSPHRYDTIDFKEVDPHLGSNQEFKELVDTLHNNDIKVIIDIALNHCGVDFFAFQDTIEQGEESVYWKWFDWKQWPLPKEIDKNFNAEKYYQCWWGVKDLPEFNYDLDKESPEENKVTNIKESTPNIALVNYLLESMRYWLEDIKIDGFRLDVPEEVPFWFWRLFRGMVKSLNPDAYLVGEIWNDPQVWLQGHYFDAIMNYHSFKDPCLDFFLHKSISLKSFINKVSSGLIHLPQRVIMSQMNLLSSHDTIRLRRLAEDNLDKLKLVLLFQFTFIGIPHIYYGDEVFLDGNKDPDNRRPFPWSYENDNNRIAILDFYKQIIRVREEHSLLSEGAIRFIEDSFLLIYERRHNSSKQGIIVILNNSEEEVDIKEFIKVYPNEILSNMRQTTLLQNGYYLASK